MENKIDQNVKKLAMKKRMPIVHATTFVKGHFKLAKHTTDLPN